MNKIEKAVSCFDGGFVCSQAILSTYGEEYGLDRDTALRIADGFGGGMARMGETCGAVVGAILVFGLKYGRTNATNSETKEKLVELVKEFMKRFRERNNSLLCRDLLGCDIDTPEKLKIAEEKGLFSTICPKYVRDAAEILEEIL